MKAVITVIGKDTVGLLARVSAVCAKNNANVLEVTQNVLQDYFAMIMIIDITAMTCELDDFNSQLKEDVPEMVIHVMHEDIFNSMHRI